MKVKKEVFDRLLACLGSANAEQSDIINEIFGDDFDGLGEHAGIFLHESAWDQDDVLGVFEQLYWTPDEVEFNRRHEKYMSDGVLSDEEQKTLRSNLRARAYDDMGFAPSVFIQHIKHRNKQLTMFLIDDGDIRDSGYSIYLHGVFETFEEGVKVLYSDGELLGD